ncbi:MAG: glycosyltransferase [Planctomycetaceae bacterium]
MNILFLSQTFPDSDSPARGTYNFALCRELAQDHQVRVISPRSWPEVWKRRLRVKSAYSAGNLVTGAGLRVEYPTYYYCPKLMQHRSGEWMAKSVRKAVRSLTKDFTPDAVLSYWAHPEGAAGLEIAQSFDVPSACIVGGSDVLLLPHGNRRRGAEVRRVLTESSAIISVSEGLREATMALGVPGERVHTVYQGIDPRQFYPGDQSVARTRLQLPPDIPVIVWVGRMVDVKCLDQLIEAAFLLHQQGHRFRLCLLGDGPLKGMLEQQVASLGMQNSVLFAGAVGHDLLPDWYRAADVTVLSSRSEGLPNVFRESLACGVPFVSTDVGSIREIADSRYSQLVPVGDPVQLMRGLVAVLTGPHREGAAGYVPRKWSDTAVEVSEILLSLKRESQRKRTGTLGRGSTMPGAGLEVRESVGHTNG